MTNFLWSTNAEMYLKICELAARHGKRPGESMEEEMETMRKMYPDQFVPLGATEKDIDQLTGDLRENGVRVVNLNEEERKRKLREGDGHGGAGD